MQLQVEDRSNLECAHTRFGFTFGAQCCRVDFYSIAGDFAGPFGDVTRRQKVCFPSGRSAVLSASSLISYRLYVRQHCACDTIGRSSAWINCHCRESPRLSWQDQACVATNTFQPDTSQPEAHDATRRIPIRAHCFMLVMMIAGPLLRRQNLLLDCRLVASWKTNT